MGDFPSGWAVLLSGLITAVGAIVVTFLQVRVRHEIRQVGDDAAAVKEQVKNSHPTNMRVEQDERHADVMRGIRTLTQSILGIQDDVRQLHKEVGVERDRVNELNARSRNGNENSGQH